MLDARELVEHAETVQGTLLVLGPRARARIVMMLGGLCVSGPDAERVLAYGIARRMFEPDPADPDVLRPVPRGRTT